MQGKTKISWAILASGLLLAVIARFFWLGGLPTPGGPSEKITIGTNLNEMLGLLFIAENRGYYQAQGLEVVIKEYQTGLGPLRDLREGRLDLVSCAEFALVGEIFTGRADQLRCLAVIGSGEVDLLIARRDKGINRPEDLRGKTIGVPRKTSAEFFLARFLTLNHISLKEVTVVDVKPSDLANALAAGKLDAVLVWAPVAHDVIKKAAPNAVVWPAQGGQNVYRLLVTREEYINKKPVVLEKLLGALERAAEFAKEHPDEAQAIIAHRLKVKIGDLQAGKSSINYELFLDQALLLAMEDQARWLIQNRLIDRAKVPNYLDYFHAEALSKVDPEAVRLIIPKAGSNNVPGPSGTRQVN